MRDQLPKTTINLVFSLNIHSKEYDSMGVHVDKQSSQLLRIHDSYPNGVISFVWNSISFDI